MSSSKEFGFKKEEVITWDDPEYCLMAVEQDDWNLEYVKNQTDEICLAAVKQNGLALQYVKNQTLDF